jgi:hypothetical protein
MIVLPVQRWSFTLIFQGEKSSPNRPCIFWLPHLEQSDKSVEALGFLSLEQDLEATG